jgi:HK97 gp10 family phage protein
MNRALEAVGIALEGYAKLMCPVDTGRLRNSITHDVRDDKVYVGTNVEYAPYVEYGTGAGVGGRSTPWKYQDAHGKWHTTTGHDPQPFIRPAVQDHLDEYKDIMEEELKGT